MEIIKILIENNYSKQIPNSKGIEDGLAYAMYLRRIEKKKNPILFTSTNDIDTVLKYPNSNIINAIGHSFLQIPKTDATYAEAIKGLNPLNDIQLSDISINYSGVRSALSNTFHEFKNDIKATINKDLADNEKAVEIKTIIERYKAILIREYPENLILFTEYNRITNLFRENDLATISHLLIDENFLANTIPTEEADIPKELIHFDWEVLLLDDNLLEIDDVIKEIESRNIRVNKAQSVQQARELIENDSNNKITVAISDYRLYIDPSQNVKKMQIEQGYDFLIWLAEKDRFTAKVALSGLSKQFLMDSFRKYSANIKVYSKTDLVNNGVRMFVDDIENFGEYNENLKNSIPTASNWEFFKPYYIAYKKLTNVDIIENYINNKTNEIIAEIKLEIDKLPRNKVGSNKIPEKDKWDLYNGITLSNFVGEGSSNFDNKTYKSITEENLDVFYKKLINRRVVIYFILYPIIDKFVLCFLLQYGFVPSYDELYDKAVEKNRKAIQKNKETIGKNKKISTTVNLNDPKELKNAIQSVKDDVKKPLFNTHSIKEEDVPFSLLLEEKLFLQEQGIEIKGYKIEYNNFHTLIKEFFINYPNKTIVDKFSETFDNTTDENGKKIKKSIKHFKNNIDKLLHDILASEPKELGLLFISDLENTVRRMTYLFPQNDDLGQLLNTILHATRR